MGHQAALALVVGLFLLSSVRSNHVATTAASNTSTPPPGNVSSAGSADGNMDGIVVFWAFVGSCFGIAAALFCFLWSAKQGCPFLYNLYLHRERKKAYVSQFETLDADGDGYISAEEFASAWSTLPQSHDTFEQDGLHKRLVWKDKKWIDERTGNPSNRKPLVKEELRGTTRLQNFPFKWLDKDNKGKISKEEFAAGFDLVEAFLAYEAGDGSALCHLLRDKYLDEKNKRKDKIRILQAAIRRKLATNPNLVVERPAPSGGAVASHGVRSTPSPGNPAPAGLPESSVTPKCDPQTLTMGCSAVAAEGLRSAVGLDNDRVFANFMKNPDLMIECEILVAGLGGHPLGCIDDIDNYYSVKFGESGDWDEKEIIMHDKYGKAPVPDHVKKSADTGKYHGGSFKKKDYDTDNEGKKLRDFWCDPASVLAGLLIYEVLILRLYTSSTYRLFNGPMRSLFTPDGQKLRHPLRFTIYVLTEGVKKLRAVEAKCDPKEFNSTQQLWRGMKNMKVDEIFMSVGGTEMAVMSTTSDKEVAVKYAKSESALVFKYNTVGLTRGVKIQFLSLYPKEVEYVYPPLTFLSVVGDTEEETVTLVEEEETVTINVTIVPVRPQMS